jgi:hypothetical protein
LPLWAEGSSAAVGHPTTGKTGFVGRTFARSAKLRISITSAVGWPLASGTGTRWGSNGPKPFDTWTRCSAGSGPRARVADCADATALETISREERTGRVWWGSKAILLRQAAPGAPGSARQALRVPAGAGLTIRWSPLQPFVKSAPARAIVRKRPTNQSNRLGWSTRE